VTHYTQRPNRKADILAMLKSAKTRGLTTRQIADRRNVKSRGILDALRELAADGLVARTGERRDRSDVWVALDA